MHSNPYVSGGLAALVALAALATPASAFLHDHWDWFERETGPPPPATVLDGAFLEDAAGKLQITTLTGLTDLTVVSWDDMDLYVVPKPTHLELRQVPTHLADVRPIQVTTLTSSDTLTLVQSPFQSWYDGMEEVSPEFDTDPTYIYRNRVPDASVQNVVALQDLVPYRSSGPATMTTQTLQVEDVVESYSNIQFTFLDVDDSLRIVETAPTYDVAAVTTAATTAVAIQNLLDEFSLAGIELTGVLSGLTSSPEKVGVVNLGGVAQHLADRGLTVRKVEDPTHSSLVYFDVGANRLDFVNPAQSTGELVLLSNRDLVNVDESKIIALKNAQSPKDTRVLLLLSRYTDDSYCACLLEYAFAPSVGGITDAAAVTDAAQLKSTGSLTRIRYEPVSPNPPVRTAPSPEADYVEYNLPYRQAYFNDVGDFDARILSTILGRPTLVPPTSTKLGPLNGAALFEYTALPAGVDDDLLSQRLQETITSWKDAYGSFTYAFRDASIGAQDRADLDAYLGQLESFAPKFTLPLLDPLFPPDVHQVQLNPNGALVHVESLDTAYEDVADLYGTVQMRALTVNSKLPVSDARVELTTFMPGFMGNTVQSFQAQTNTFGYASFSLTPYTAYNFTVTKDGYVETGGAGASPGNGETQGRDVRMTPLEGAAKIIDKIATPMGLTLLLASVLVLVLVVRRLRRGASRRRR